MSEAYSTLQEISQRFDSEDLALLSNHPDFCFTINSYELFSHHVFSRVKRQNPDKSITHEKTRITIQSDETSDVLHLYPTWKMIEKRVDIEAFHEINDVPKRESGEKEWPVRLYRRERMRETTAYHRVEAMEERMVPVYGESHRLALPSAG